MLKHASDCHSTMMPIAHRRLCTVALPQACDVYSLAIIMWELATQKRP